MSMSVRRDVRYMNSASRMHHVSRDCIIPGLSVGRKIKSDKAHKDLAESPEYAKNSPLGAPDCVFS